MVRGDADRPGKLPHQNHGVLIPSGRLVGTSRKSDVLGLLPSSLLRSLRNCSTPLGPRLVHQVSDWGSGVAIKMQLALFADLEGGLPYGIEDLGSQRFVLHGSCE